VKRGISWVAMAVENMSGYAEFDISEMNRKGLSH